MTESVRAIRRHVKHPDESVAYAVDFTKLLASGETLTGTPTVVSAAQGQVPDADNLTIETPAVNTATIIDDEGNAVAIGKAVQVRVEDGTDQENYDLTVTCGTTGGDTRVGVVGVDVRAG